MFVYSLFYSFAYLLIGAFLAFKAGRRELVNSSAIFELFYPDYNNLSVPLFAIVDYCGYQVSCVGLLPLEGIIRREIFYSRLLISRE